MKAGSVQSSFGRMNADVMIFSPPKADSKLSRQGLPDIDAENIPTILCAKFQKSLRIDFEKVNVKSTSLKKFKLLNPSNEKPVTVAIQKVPDDKGLSLNFGVNITTEYVVIRPNDSVIATVYWTPFLDSVLKENIILSIDKEFHLQLSVNGVSGIGQVRNFCWWGSCILY